MNKKTTVEQANGQWIKEIDVTVNEVTNNN
jgi:hypothetical protein